MEKVRLNNGMLVSRDWNCSRMIASHMSGHASHQCSVLTAIKK